MQYGLKDLILVLNTILAKEVFLGGAGNNVFHLRFLHRTMLSTIFKLNAKEMKYCIVVE